MDLLKNFSQSDFFNYYLAGTIWLSDLVFMVLLVNVNSDELSGWLTEEINVQTAAIFGILAVILPYLLGFIATPLGNWITIKRRPKLERIVVDLNQNKVEKSIKHLTRPLVETIHEEAEILFGKIDDKSLYFDWIRAYVWQRGGPAVDLAIRAQALSNLAESLLIPVPLLGLLIAILVGRNLLDWPPICGLLIGAFLAICFAILIWKRYVMLREYYVKHVYRAFLVIRRQKK